MRELPKQKIDPASFWGQLAIGDVNHSVAIPAAIDLNQ